MQARADGRRLEVLLLRPGVTGVTAIGSFDMLPMLGRGKHRNPKRGACFMELASYLAGRSGQTTPRAPTRCSP
ncbi:hypothetical protein GCM10025865_10180 [Paraoerskovia sediminicola]|uniref:Uncharacterized protein n=1 Tax=Paraoerskovia sediminicola TaxID=1138587 RepID=A0ABN6XA75_9CELL|nr:hypothetical protein GCM10025865_10180 [Paraoerskovia sediminicola]